MRFSGGPILSRFVEPGFPDYTCLAVYRTETWTHGFQKGTMIGTPAIIAAHFGSGCVMAIGPHLEMTTEGEVLLARVIHAVARKRTGGQTGQL